MSDVVTVHIVHPGNPFSADPDGIVSVQRNFAAAAPEDLAIEYWGVRRPGLVRALDGPVRFHPVISSPSQRPIVPLSLKFAAGLVRVRRHIGPGVLRFDRIESVLPFLSSSRPKVLFLHVWDLDDVTGPRSDSRWRRFSSLYGRILDAAVAAADRTYVLRRDVGDQLAARVAGCQERVRLFSVPVDLAAFTISEATARRDRRAAFSRALGVPQVARIVVFAGRLETVKRPLAIPEIAASLARSDQVDGPRTDGRPVHFVVAGTGSLRGALMRSARTLAPGRIHMLGSVPQPRMAEILGLADACLLPSGFEAVPNIVLESLACGTPVVASASSGGVSDLIAGRGIGLLAGQDPKAIAAALRSVFSWEGGREEACRAAAMAFAPDRVNEELYEDVRALTREPAPVACGPPARSRTAGRRARAPSRPGLPRRRSRTPVPSPRA